MRKRERLDWRGDGIGVENAGDGAHERAFAVRTEAVKEEHLMFVNAAGEHVAAEPLQIVHESSIASGGAIEKFLPSIY